MEAELFGEYDVMVPGPPPSMSVAAAAEGGANSDIQERTGRPLAINLDLLSYNARQKAIAVSWFVMRSVVVGVCHHVGRSRSGSRLPRVKIVVVERMKGGEEVLLI